MTAAKKSSFKLDWQHVALGVVALAGAAVCFMIPDLAKFAGPVISALVPLAIAKNSPLEKSEGGVAHVKRGETIVINVGSAPAEVSLGEDGGLKIRWPDS